MERPNAPSGQQAESDVTAPVRFAVIVGEPAGDSACRIEAPGRLLRVWSLLQATYEEIDHAALPPAGTPRLQRQLREIRRELENTVSPSLAAELRRIAPPREEAPSAAGLRIECAMLTSWAGSLTMQMLGTLAAARERLSRQPKAA
jgi:proteasome activator-like protein